jgi:hypothetical protein
MMKRAYMAIVTLIAVSGYSQSTINDFARVKEKYLSLTSLSTEIEYVVFSGHENGRAVDIKNGSYKSNMRDAFRYEVDGTIQLHNPKYDIVVSSEDRIILVKKNNGKPDGSTLLPGVDTSGAVWNNAIKIGEGNDIRTWRVTFKNTASEYDKIDISIDTKTFLVKSVSLYYRIKMSGYLYSEDPSDDYLPKMTITYKNTVTNPVLAANEFSESRFIQVSEGKTLPAPTFKTYEITLQNP